MNVEMTSASRLLRALERVIPEETWKSNFEQTSGDKKRKEPRMIGDDMFRAINVYF